MLPLCGGVDNRPVPEAGPLLSTRRGCACDVVAFGVERGSTAGAVVVTRPGWTVPFWPDDSVTRAGGAPSVRPAPGRAVVGAAGAVVVTRLGGVALVRFDGSVTRLGGMPFDRVTSGRAVVGAAGVVVVTRPG